jgi:peptide/nickel transport system substrate-binding protein
MADDFVFGVELLTDAQLPLARSSGQSAIAGATAPDPQTLVIDYRKVYAQANASGPIDVVAVPRHLLGELYAKGDKQTLMNNPYWMTEFVGTGPYKLGDWAHGSTVEAIAFDQYFMGRPKIDRIIYTVMPDDNVIYVNLLAGSIDVTTMGGFLIDNVVRAREEWEAKGLGTVLALFAGTRDYRFQFLNPAAPWAKDVRVRQALTHMLDRNLLAETIQFGLTTSADTIVSPSDPVYALLEQRGLARYPYDLNRAQRLMVEAGWNRGADGVYRSAAGDSFSIDIQNTNSTEDIKQAVAVAGQWNAAGILTTNTPVANGATNINELQHTFPGVQASPQRDTLEALESLLSNRIGTAANRWQGDNRNNYVNPTIDHLYEQALVTLDTPTRLGLMADILKIEAEEVPAIHMFYYMSRQSVTFRKGVTGPGLVPTNQMVNAWNIETWDVS